MTIVQPSSLLGLVSRDSFSMERIILLIFLSLIIITVNSCNYEEFEKIAIVSGIAEDGTEVKSVAKEDCTKFSVPSIPSTVSSGGLSVNLVIIQITFEGSIIEKSYGDPFAQQSFKSGTSCWANKIFGTGTGQLNEYWQEVSYGKFMVLPASETHGINNDGIITVGLSGNHPNFNKTSSSGVYTDTYFSEALTKADPYIDFSQYDSNNDGHLSTIELQVMFLVAGGESAAGGFPGIWAHKSCIPKTLSNGAVHPTHDGYSIAECGYQGYSTFGERQPELTTTLTGKMVDARIGTIAHELAHAIFCLPDLYDYTGNSKGIGTWGLMASGASGNSRNGDYNFGSTPTHLTAWSKYKTDGSWCYNWYGNTANYNGVVFELPDNISSSSSSVTLYHSTHTNFNTKIINIPGKTKEYFMVENIGHDGYQQGLNHSLWDVGEDVSGIAIWHIDENQLTNDNVTHKLVDLEEAADAGLDNKNHLGKRTNLFYSGNKTDFSNSTDPNSKSYDGNSSGITINNISAPGESMTLDISF